MWYVLFICVYWKYNLFLEREDGTLEIMTAPIALMPQNNMMSSTLVKTMDGNFILHPVCISSRKYFWIIN